MSHLGDKSILNILILGNSSKFIEAIKLYYPCANLIIVSWRGIVLSNNEFIKNESLFDMVFVCGYDYRSYSKTYDDYLNVNVYSVLAIISRFKNCRKIVYVDTKDTGSRYTFSRYVYAKKLLGRLLVATAGEAECHIMKPCTIVTDKIEVYSSWLELTIFKVLKSVGLVKTVTINSLFENLLDKHYIVSTSVTCPIPILLIIPRTRFIDRGLRLLYG